MADKKKSPVKAISLMMIITLLGKILGLVRDRLLTVNYGSGIAANAFLTASRIPRVFFDTVFASAISASLIPVFSEELKKKNKAAAFDFAGNFISVMALLCAVLTALGMVFADSLTTFFADGFDAETAALCADLTRIMIPTVLFTGVAFSFVGILQSMEEFNIPAAISFVSNAAVILYYFTLNEKYGIYGLAVTFLVAWLLQAVVQIPALRKKGFVFRPSLSLKTEGMRKVMKLMLPVMVSTWVLPINQTINSKFGSRLFAGSGVTAIELAYNLYTVIAGVFILSVTNFVFPRLSAQNAEGDRAGLKATISGTMHSSLFVVVPMTAGLAVMAEPIIDFIYGGGVFGADSVSMTGRALMFMTLGMVGYAAQSVLCRVYFAEQSGKVPLVAGTLAIITNVALCVALTEPLDVAGIAIASSASFTVNGVALAIPLKKRGLAFWNRAFAADMLRILVSSAFMAAVAWGLKTWLSARVGELLVLALPIAAGIAVYAAAAIVLKVPEAVMVKNIILRKVSGKGAGEDA